MNAHALTLIVLIVLLSLSPVAMAGIHPDERMTDPVNEARAQSLYTQLRCTVCQNQTIAESDADIAADLRRLVRKKITEGESDQEIIAYIHSRYGDFVLMRPPLHANTVLLWFGPFIIFVAGGLVCLRLFSRKAGR